MTEPKPVYSVKGNGNGHNGNGRCDCEDRMERLLRAARRELRKVEPGTHPATYLLGEVYILDMLLKHTDDKPAAPLVRPTAEVCAWPQEAACPT